MIRRYTRGVVAHTRGRATRHSQVGALVLNLELYLEESPKELDLLHKLVQA